MRAWTTALVSTTTISLWSGALWGQLASAERDLRDLQVHSDAVLRPTNDVSNEAIGKDAGQECSRAEVRQHSVELSLLGGNDDIGSGGPQLHNAHSASGAGDAEIAADATQGQNTLAASTLAPTEESVEASASSDGSPVGIDTSKCKNKPVTSLKWVFYDVHKEFANEANCGMGYYRVGPNLGDERYQNYLCVSHRPEKGNPVTGVYLKAQSDTNKAKPCGEDHAVKKTPIGDDPLVVNVNPRTWWPDMRNDPDDQGAAIMPWNWPWWISMPRFFPFSNVGKAKQMYVCFTRNTTGDYADTAAGFKRVMMPRSLWWTCSAKGGKVVKPGSGDLDKEAWWSIRSVSSFDLDEYFPKYTTFASHTYLICLIPNKCS